MTEGLAAASAPRGSVALGLGVAAFSAASFGFITTLARLSYLGGGSPETVIAARYLTAILVLGAIVLVLRRPLAFTRGDWPQLLVATLGVFGLTVGYLSAVAYIPVGLAALIFYTFPLMVAAFTAVSEWRTPGWRAAAGFLAAFAGLALALGPAGLGLEVASRSDMPGRHALSATMAVLFLLLAAAFALWWRRPLRGVWAAWLNLTAAILLILAVGILHPLLVRSGA